MLNKLEAFWRKGTFFDPKFCQEFLSLLVSVEEVISALPTGRSPECVPATSCSQRRQASVSSFERELWVA